MSATLEKSHLVILDLDETLIYASDEGDLAEWDFEVPPFKVRKRPHVDEFVAAVTDWFDVAVWTSSSENYGLEMVNHLFPHPERLRFMWSRRRCTWQRMPETGECYWAKNLKKVRRMGYPLERVIVVDNEARGLRQSYGNVVAVKSFLGQSTDEDLLLLTRYLGWLRTISNVRTVDKRNWKEHFSVSA